MRVRLLVAVCAAFVLVGGGVATAMAASSDYTQGVTALNASQAKVW